MSHQKKYASFKNHIFIIGFGSIGQGTLPLILRHFDVKPEQITIITADENGKDLAAAAGIEFLKEPLTRENYRQVLGSRLKNGDFVVNVSVDVCSVSLMELCQEKGALYVDTVIEPWGGTYLDATRPATERSNYALREKMLAVQPKHKNGTTAVVCHGANPGLANHFVKQALINMAKDTGLKTETPTSREGWAELAQKLEIKVIHIAERDTQISKDAKKVDEFVGTWSIDGLYSEGNQPAELGWGTHEKALPQEGLRHPNGCGAAILLNRRGCTTRVRSWTPLEGPYHGFLITHNESISLADYFTLRKDEKVVYRPTCHYAYHPCDATVLSLHEVNGKNGRLQSRIRLMMDDIIDGTDELGVLLMGNKKGVYWFGSRLSIHQTRKLIPNNNATSLQVAAAVLSGMVWALENPNRGFVEPEHMDFNRILDIATPYLGDVVGVWGDWDPLKERDILFPEDIDTTDPWQFKNILVG